MESNLNLDRNLDDLGRSLFRVRLELSYDGTDFCGWQSQLVHKNKKSLQTILQAALSKICKEPVHLVSSGRTDAGVHALAQNVHFTTTRDPRTIPLLLALRTLLPPSIVVRRAWLVPREFCANTSAKAKTYRYYIYNDRAPSPMLGRYSYWYQQQLDLSRLQALANEIIGTHDFKVFQSCGGTPPKSSRRRVFKAEWRQPKQKLFVFEITGNGFLRQMIRNLVSTQLDLLARNLGPNEIHRLLESQNRRLIGKPAPPQGLLLSRVYYPKHLIARSEELIGFS